jgi:ferredoxin-thioredoxin reductase catalytic subunit
MQKGFVDMKITVNTDKELVTLIREKLKANDGYCPCRLTKSDDTKCICKDFLEQDEGVCHCGLYIKIKE